VFRNRRQGINDLRDALNANETKISQMKPGDFLEIKHELPEPTQVYLSKEGQPATLVTASKVEVKLWLDPATGELHLIHFAPIP
jgi:hypothetical protein